MIIERGELLYRYSLGVGMPEIWQTDLHSPEYSYEDLGCKNQIGSFFFYCNEETARTVLNTAIANVHKRGQYYERNTITICRTTDDLRLLDLTNCSFPINILNILYDEGIDVLNDSFIKHLNRTNIQKFTEIRRDFENIIDSDGCDDNTILAKRIGWGNKINDFFYNCVGYIGQLLTDFENGKEFKILLQERGYDGYAFDEEQTSPTICIFESVKLSAPEHIIV